MLKGLILSMACLSLAAGRAPLRAEEPIQEDETSIVEDIQEEETPKAGTLTEEEVRETVDKALAEIDWKEVLDHIQDAEWWKAAVAAVLSFLGANAAVILVMAIKIIAQKAKNGQLLERFTSIVKEYAKATNQSETEVCDKLCQKMDELKADIDRRLDAADKKEEKAKLIASADARKAVEDL